MSAKPLQILNLIDGKLAPANNGQTLEVFEPATGAVYAQCPDSDTQDIDLAVAAAKAAFPAWSQTAAQTRADLMLKLAALIEANFEEFVAAESQDCGKPISLARRMDIPRAISNLQFFAAAATQFSSESHSVAGQSIDYTLRQALGPVACISPWNLPLYLLTWKIAPALAAGNTVVAKPSEVTPYSAFLLSKLIIEAGFPAGVINIVHGLGERAGAALVAHVDIKAISFTGSTAVGARIAQVAAPMFRKVSLELGGKNPYIVFDDANFELAVDSAVRAAFTNQGQICLCGSRFLVHANIYDKFRDALLERARQWIASDPHSAESKIGAIVSKAHFEKIIAAIETAKQEGGKLLLGGKAVKLSGRCANGWFIEPSIFENLNNACATNQTEVFGPLVTLQKFDTDAEALELANQTQYGLAASMWTQDINRAHRLAAQLEFGIVWINTWLQRDLRTPFGGSKQSGLGREGGLEAMRFFTEAKNISINLN